MASRTRTADPAPARADWQPVQAYRAEERRAWQALAAVGERPAHYRGALLTWRAARYALDVALSPLPCRRPA